MGCWQARTSASSVEPFIPDVAKADISVEHPLALFLDDLQWLDAATLKLLEDLIVDPDVQHLLLIGAFRANEVSSSHPLIQTLDAIRQTEAVVHDIVLAPLSLEDVTELVADTLHCSYKFVHDRAWEATYSLIPEELRAEAHLRIGRLLTKHTPPEKLEEAIFEILNQVNRGAALITFGPGQVAPLRLSQDET